MADIEIVPVTTARVDADRNARLMRQATYAAVVVAIVLIVIKAVALQLTGSVAMLGNLVDSLLDGAASLLNLVAVRHSLTPADDSHRFGHGKAEALAGLGQSIFIFGSAAFVSFEALNRFADPMPVVNTTIGLIVTVAAIVITLALVAFQRHVVKHTASLAIQADSTHYSGDLFMNISVIAALILAGHTSLYWADAALGLAIAVLIGYSAVRIALGAYDQLMDHELSDSGRENIKSIALGHPEVVSIHDLRTRTSGSKTFIQFHVELDPTISLMRAHEISDDVEARIVEAIPDAEVMIHQDPAGLEELTPLQRG